MTGDRKFITHGDILRHLANAVATTMLYTPEHPQVAACIPRILDPLSQILAGREELTFIMSKGEILHQGRPLEKTPHLERLVRTCTQRNIGHITFCAGVEAADLRQLIRCLSGVEKLTVLQEKYSKIRIGSVETDEETELGQFAPIESFEHLTSTQLAGLQDVYSGIGAEGPVDIQNVTAMVGGFIVAFKMEADPLMALVPLRNIDDYTFTHSVNVGILNIAQGMSLGIDGQMLHDLGIAGMLHDAGKIFVDQEIIRKPDKLTDDEWDIMKTHPSRGAQYLMEQKGIPTVAVICAYEHHMRYDLSGYPPPPSKWRLNLSSQITMISDTFDALRTRRAYQSTLDFPKASGLMLKLAGKNLNPDLTINFLKLLAKLGAGLSSLPPDDTTPLKGNYCE